MMLPGLEQMQRAVLRLACGLACAGAAFVLPGTLAAGMLWIGALAIACLGYGGVVDRLSGRHWSTAITAVTGMAVLLGISTLLAHAGVLARPVQITAVLAGIMLCLITGEPREAPRPALAMRIYVLAACAFAIGIELVAPHVSFADSFNHAMFVKRLWDTGGLGFAHHQLGLQVVGESYVSLMSGATTAGTFELGACVAMLVYVLSIEIGAQPGPLAHPIVLVLTVPVVLWASMSVQWSGAVLYIAMFIALQRAREANVRAWHACVLAVALLMLRHEYFVVALPFFALAVMPTWSRRGAMIAIALWFVAMIPFQLTLAVPVARAVINAALLVIALPIVPAGRRLLAPGRGPDALSAVVFATVMYGLSLLTDAIRTAQHSDAGVVTVGFGGAACVCWLLARKPGARTIHLGAAMLAIAILVGYTITGPNFGNGRYKAVNRVMHATIALRQTLMFGGPHDLEAAVAKLQTLVPRGARIGFWGVSAGALDYRRNAVTDLTRSGKRDESMVPMSAADLRRVDYVLLENLEPATEPDVWDTRSTPTATVDGMLELRATSDGAYLFRVRR